VTRWQAFVTICDYFRAGLLGGKLPKPDVDLPWELLVEISSFHFVTPALAWCLRERSEIPSEICDYFDAALALNGQRNERMLEGLDRIVDALNAIDIEPVLLKGIAHLVEGVYPEPALRFLGDVDILIPADRSVHAVAALRAKGFDTKKNGVVPPPSHHHLEMLVDSQTGTGVELHTEVFGEGLHQSGFSTAWFCENSQPARFRGGQIRLPDATRSVAHNIVHSQFFHGLYWQKRIELRHLLDLAVIRAKREGEIDWIEIDRRCCSAGLGEGLATYLNIAESLFNQPAPQLSSAPRQGAMTDLERAESRDHFHSKIEQLTAYRDELVTRLSRMTEERDHFRAEAERLAITVKELRTALGLPVEERARAAFLASTLWRLTQPLRAIAAALRRWRKSWSRH
jgi:hypothetical protein